jgi:hypothetical protein
VRVFQQTGRKAFLDGAVGGAHHAGQQADDGVQQHQRGGLAARQHVVAEADFFHAARFDHALIDALVAAAQQDDARRRRRAARRRLAEPPAARRQAQDRPFVGDRSSAASTTSGRSTMPAPPPNGVSSTE